MTKVYDFWITIQNLDEQEAKNLYQRHYAGSIHCTVFPEKTFIYGVAAEHRINAIVDDIKNLGNDYGLVTEEVI